MDVKYLDLAGQAFAFEAPPVEYKRCCQGHISYTFFVDCGEGNRSYVLQKLNLEIFKDPAALMSNIKGVCSHIKEKIKAEGGDVLREVRTVIETKAGEDYYVDPEGGYWRAFLAIDNVVSYDFPDSPELFYKSAVAFGKFARQLDDYPASTLYEIIPDFHNTKKRMDDFKAAVKADKMGRAAEVADEIDFILSKEPVCSYITDGLKEGRFKTRVTHNDTKISNVLMDAESGEGVCIIDLDIVMPGSILYDFGDAIRVGASTAAEDEKDPSRVGLDLFMFETFVEGFVTELRGYISDEEILSLPMGAYLMTLETGLRFLGDYLNGDVYYHISYPEHNRDRAKNQLCLLSDMEAKMGAMQEIVKKYL